MTPREQNVAQFEFPLSKHESNLEDEATRQFRDESHCVTLRVECLSTQQLAHIALRWRQEKACGAQQRKTEFEAHTSYLLCIAVSTFKGVSRPVKQGDSHIR